MQAGCGSGAANEVYRRQLSNPSETMRITRARLEALPPTVRPPCSQRRAAAAAVIEIRAAVRHCGWGQVCSIRIMSDGLSDMMLQSRNSAPQASAVSIHQSIAATVRFARWCRARLLPPARLESG